MKQNINAACAVELWKQETRTDVVMVAQRFVELHFESNQEAGVCSICGKSVQKRDRLCRGYECGCHDRFYIE